MSEKIGTVTLARRREYPANPGSATSEWVAVPPGTYDVMRDENGLTYWAMSGTLIEVDADFERLSGEPGNGLFAMTPTVTPVERDREIESFRFDYATFAAFVERYAPEAGMTFVLDET